MEYSSGKKWNILVEKVALCLSLNFFHLTFISINFSISLFAFLSLCISVSLSISHSISLSLSLHLFIHLSDFSFSLCLILLSIGLNPLVFVQNQENDEQQETVISEIDSYINIRINRMINNWQRWEAYSAVEMVGRCNTLLHFVNVLTNLIILS